MDKKQKRVSDAGLVRLNKFISDSGVTSRRKADFLIETGKVTVNGKKVNTMGFKVDPKEDHVTVQGKAIKIVEDKVYLLLNKPPQVMTTLSDPEGRPTVAEYVQDLSMRVYPVGRLDWDSEGMLIMTNDGDFANKVMHPRYAIPKTYMAKVSGHPTDEDLEKLIDGVTIIGGKARAILVERLTNRGGEQYDWIKIIIDEGRNRQVRNMFEKIGFDVIKLQRVGIGRLSMGDMNRGEYRLLGPKDLERLFMTDDDVARRDAKKSRYTKPRRPAPLDPKKPAVKFERKRGAEGAKGRAARYQGRAEAAAAEGGSKASARSGSGDKAPTRSPRGK